MKVFVALSVLFAVAAAKPYLVHTVPLAYSSQYHAQDALGQYSYGYADHLSSKSEVKSFDGITRGGYTYVDAEGKPQSVQYTADAVNGFRVSASNLPKAPEVPVVPAVEAPKPVEDTPEVAAAKAQHFEAVKEAEALAAAAPEEEQVHAYVAPAVTAYAAPILAYGHPHGFQYSTHNHHFAAPYAAPYYYHY